MATLEGIDVLERKVKAMDLAVQRKVLRTAVKRGAELIRDEMAYDAPRLTGHLAEREIVSMVDSAGNAYYTLARIGPARDAFYGQFLEFGTAFVTEDPFVNPAFERTKDKAEAYVARIFKDTVEGI